MQARRYAFTWNNYMARNVECLKSLPATKCDYVICGFEIGENGVPHIQGYVEFKSPITIKTAKGRLDPDMKKHSPVHVEVANRNRDANINYCKKVDTQDLNAANLYNGGLKYFEITHVQRHQGSSTSFIELRESVYANPRDLSIVADEHTELFVKHFAGVQALAKLAVESSNKNALLERYGEVVLQNWQSSLLLELQVPADLRKITWICDLDGGRGKTWFSLYMVAVYGAIIFNNSSTRDIAHIYNYEPIVFFDLTRSLEGVVNYSIMEHLKNGYLMSSKYNGGVKVFPSPHVVVMANWMPNLTAMSRDRWDIRSFVGENLI